MFANPSAPQLTGNFNDPNLPSGYAPFNVQNLNGQIYVAYALKPQAATMNKPAPGSVTSVFSI